MSPEFDICAITRSGASRTTEVHVLTGSSEYQEFSLHVPTGLHVSDRDYVFLFAPNRDLFIVRKKAPTNCTELHVLSFESGYKAFVKHVTTAMHPTNDPTGASADSDYDFCLAPNLDLYIIKKKGADNSTEVHVLSAASNYQAFSLHTITGLHSTDSGYKFLLAANLDLYLVRKQGANLKTELHILSRSSGYKKYSLHTGTGLHSTDSNWDFLLGPNNDLVVIRKHGADNKTEVHTLSAASNYQDFTRHTITNLHQTDGTWSFVLYPAEVPKHRDMVWGGPLPRCPWPLPRSPFPPIVWEIGNKEVVVQFGIVMN